MKLGVVFVILDSLAPACGPEPETADAVVPTLDACRLFDPAARLVIAHVSHAGAASDDPKPYGSVFVYNLCRNIYHVRGLDHGDDRALALLHKKRNNGPKLAPRGFRFTFGPGTVTLLPHSLKDDPDATKGAPLGNRIAIHLAGHGRQTVPVIAEALNAKPDTVRRTLTRDGDSKHPRFHKFDDETWGLLDVMERQEP